MNNHTCLECGAAALARSLCSAHYQRARRTGVLPPKPKNPSHHKVTDVDPVARSGTCSICGPTRVRIRGKRHGVECATVRRRHLNEYRDTHPEVAHPAPSRADRLKIYYGLTLERFDEMVVEQDGACAICGEVPEYVLNVDHDHSTGAVRGLLCRPCNLGIGHLREDPRILRSSLAYLRKHR